MILDLRECDPITDRAACHAVLRAALRREPAVDTIHPGDWDWWCFHRDVGRSPVQLVGSKILVDFATDTGELVVFGADPGELVEIIGHFGPAVRKVGFVDTRDHERISALDAAGFEPDGEIPWPMLARDPAGGVGGLRPLPSGIEIRPLAGAAEVPARSAAARRAFASAMEPEQHIARYRAFTQSPAYERTRDIVAVDEAGRVASFTVHWIDRELSLAQLEPVGTDPDFARRGIARAVLADTFSRLAAAGMRRVRVTTEGSNAAAIALYESCGFSETGRVDLYQRRQ